MAPRLLRLGQGIGVIEGVGRTGTPRIATGRERTQPRVQDEAYVTHGVRPFDADEPRCAVAVSSLSRRSANVSVSLTAAL
jgi:hypothetical protein